MTIVDWPEPVAPNIYEKDYFTFFAVFLLFCLGAGLFFEN